MQPINLTSKIFQTFGIKQQNENIVLIKIRLYNIKSLIPNTIFFQKMYVYIIVQAFHDLPFS